MGLFTAAIRFRTKISKLDECFFFDALVFLMTKQFFQLSQLWLAITQSVKLTFHLCYTFLEPSGCQLSHGGTLDICCSSKISINLPKWESGCRSDDIDASRLGHSSFWALCPKFSREHVKNVSKEVHLVFSYTVVLLFSFLKTLLRQMTSRIWTQLDEIPYF